MFNSCVEVIDVAAHHIGKITAIALIGQQRCLGVIVGLAQDAQSIQVKSSGQVLPARVLGNEFAFQASR